MSTENQDQPQTEPPEKEAHTEPKHSKMNDMGDKASAKLHSLENQFVSLSSQRQLNFILGALILLSAFTGGIGFLIALGLGVLMIFQGVTGKTLLNDFIDKMDQKHKKWLVPGFIGAVALIMVLSIVFGFINAGDSDNPRSQYSQQR